MNEQESLNRANGVTRRRLLGRAIVWAAALLAAKAARPAQADAPEAAQEPLSAGPPNVVADESVRYYVYDKSIPEPRLVWSSDDRCIFSMAVYDGQNLDTVYIDHGEGKTSVYTIG